MPSVGENKITGAFATARVGHDFPLPYARSVPTVAPRCDILLTMKRRAFFGLFQVLAIPPPPAAYPQKFGSTNPPQCPLCHTPVPANTPAYLPVIQNASDGTTAALPNLRDMFCTACGNRWVTSA